MQIASRSASVAHFHESAASRNTIHPHAPCDRMTGGAPLTKHCKHCRGVLRLPVGAACRLTSDPQVETCKRKTLMNWILVWRSTCCPSYSVVELWRLWICVFRYLTLYSVYTALLWGQSASDQSERQTAVWKCKVAAFFVFCCIHKSVLHRDPVILP